MKKIKTEKHGWRILKQTYVTLINPLNPESDQHLISPYSDHAESFSEVREIKGMISNPRSFSW